MRKSVLKMKALLEELAQSGSPVDLSVAETELENEKVEIEQIGGIIESHLFELEDGRIACMAYIAVTNQTARTIDVVDVELRATWDDSVFQLLTPTQVKFYTRAKVHCSHTVYRFPGNRVQFECAEVLNHCLMERRKLPGKRLERWLLAIGGPMPLGLHHGQWLDMRLTIIGSDHAEYSKTILLWTDRLQARTKIVKTRIPIFASPLEEEAILACDVTPAAPLPANQPPASNRN